MIKKTKRISRHLRISNRSMVPSFIPSEIWQCYSLHSAGDKRFPLAQDVYRVEERRVLFKLIYKLAPLRELRIAESFDAEMASKRKKKDTMEI